MPKTPIPELKKDIVLKARLRNDDFTFHTTWGLFSPENIDEGTELLIDAVDSAGAKTILDLGCGYGAIGIVLAKSAPEAEVHMVDKDFVAVEYAKKNSVLNRVSNVQTYLSNGFDQVPHGTKFDLIVSNLPAKISKEYFWILFAEALEHLKPGGSFYVVTIAGLRRFIQKNFELIFGNYELLANKKTYFVARAVKQ